MEQGDSRFAHWRVWTVRVHTDSTSRHLDIKIWELHRKEMGVRTHTHTHSKAESWLSYVKWMIFQRSGVCNSSSTNRKLWQGETWTNNYCNTRLDQSLLPPLPPPVCVFNKHRPSPPPISFLRFLPKPLSPPSASTHPGVPQVPLHHLSLIVLQLFSSFLSHTFHPLPLPLASILLWLLRNQTLIVYTPTNAKKRSHMHTNPCTHRQVWGIC